MILKSSRGFSIFSKNKTFELVIQGEVYARAGFYPYFNPELNPDHPNNIYIDIESEQLVMYSSLMENLLQHLLSQVNLYIKNKGLTNVRIFHFSRKITPGKQALFKRYGFYRTTGLVVLNKQIESVEDLDLDMLEEVNLDDKKTIDQIIFMYNKIFSEAKTMSWIDDLKQNPDFKIVVYKTEDRIDGAILYYDAQSRNQDYGFIEALFVAKLARGNGIGKLLLNHANDTFLEKGYDYSKLELWASNTKAHKFYMNQGYKEERTIGTNLIKDK